MDVTAVASFGAGLALLTVGGEALVRGASRLARIVGVSPFAVGLTVVSLGTSAPELAVSIQSVLLGQAGLALGNAVGSNIVNVLLILGVSALIVPLAVARQSVRLDVPVMIVASIVLLGMGADGTLDRLDGLLLALGAVAYTGLSLYLGLTEEAASEEDGADARPTGAGRARALALQVVLIVAGLGTLVLGASWLVDGAVSLARALGLSDFVIGLTVVAIGTSLPEAATSIMASVRGERDIAVGNVVGSNIFNIALVLGVTALVAPTGIDVPQAATAFDVPVMVGVAFACLPIFFTGYCIARWEGALFVAYYVAYVAYLLLNAAEHDALPIFSTALMVFVLPLTGLTLAVLVLNSARADRPTATPRRS